MIADCEEYWQAISLYCPKLFMKSIQPTAFISLWLRLFLIAY